MRRTRAAHSPPPSERTGPIALGALIRFTMSRANSGAFSRTNDGYAPRSRISGRRDAPPKPLMRSAHVGEEAAARLLAVVADVDAGVELARDTGRVAARAAAASSPGSTGSPRLFRTNIAFSASGRGRLPACVVRIRSSLRFMGGLFQICANRRNSIGFR